MARSYARKTETAQSFAAADAQVEGAARPGSAASSARKPRKPRLTREEKSEITREAICQAAAEIIGEHGYANASIARIMERAGLGHGTFYSYFDSRQDLFDELLPMKGEEVLSFLHERVRGAPDFVETEQRGILGFFEYAQEHPWFFRLLHEAHVATPEGHQRHIGNILARYRKSLARAHAAGELPGYDASELDTLAFLLMSARDYVYSHHVARSDDVTAAVKQAVGTYAKFIAHGLRGKAQDAADNAGAPPPGN